MIRLSTRMTVKVGFCCLLMSCLLMPRYGFSQEKKASVSREERAHINYVLTLETEKEIRTFLSQPVALLTEKILKDIEKEKEIQLVRSSMVKTDACLHELLTGIANLTKMSCGHKISQVNIKLTASTSRATIWTSWEVRKLETPALTLTLYYDDPDVAPSEITCMGHKYH